MVLVPSETVERMTSTVSHDPLNELHKELTKILSSRTLSDSEKWASYQQVLSRCLHHAEKRRKPLVFSIDAVDESNGLKQAEIDPPLPHLPPSPQPRRVSPPPVVSQSLVQSQEPHHSRALEPASEIDEILATLPPTYRMKGSILLQRLSKIDSIGWDALGRVRIENKKIQGSNIADLINDALRSRKSVIAPSGFKEFYRLLAKLNVPQELIGNKERWNLIRESAAEVTSPDSPYFDTLWPAAPVKVKKKKVPKNANSQNLNRLRRKLDWETFEF